MILSEKFFAKAPLGYEIALVTSDVRAWHARALDNYSAERTKSRIERAGDLRRVPTPRCQHVVNGGWDTACR